MRRGHYSETKTCQGTCPGELPFRLESSESIESQKPYWEGQGDLVSRLIMGISRVTIWVIDISPKA